MFAKMILNKTSRTLFNTSSLGDARLSWFLFRLGEEAEASFLASAKIEGTETYLLGNADGEWPIGVVVEIKEGCLSLRDVAWVADLTPEGGNALGESLAMLAMQLYADRKVRKLQFAATDADDQEIAGKALSWAANQTPETIGAALAGAPAKWGIKLVTFSATAEKAEAILTATPLALLKKGVKIVVSLQGLTIEEVAVPAAPAAEPHSAAQAAPRRSAWAACAAAKAAAAAPAEVVDATVVAETVAA